MISEDLDNLGDLLSRNARKIPREFAVISRESQYTWEEVNDRTNSLAQVLNIMGVVRGDRIATLTRNRAEWYEMSFAGFMIGAPLVRLNYWFAAEELAYIINDSGATTLILDDNHVDIVQSIIPLCPTLNNIICIGKPSEGMEEYERLITKYTHNKYSAPKKIGGDDLSSIIYTSGTTGNPKGVMHTHRSALYNVINNARPLRLKAGMRFLHVFPGFFSAGVMNLLFGAYIPMVNIIMDWDVERVIDTIEKEKIQVTGIAPTMFAFMLESPNLEKHDLSSLKTIYYAASPMPLAMLKESMHNFKCDFIQFYGTTETGPSGSVLEPDDHILEGSDKEKKRLTSAGKEQANIRVRVVDEKGLDVAPGELGEIIVNSPGNMIGYWNLPEETERVLKDGFVYTGDVGRMDEDSYLYIVDRKKDLIISGGINIYPVEIERVIYQHPSVLEVAVIGVPDKKWGESIKAIVTLKKGKTATEKEIIDSCKENLASYKKPKSVDFVDALPKSPAGKIIKRKLRDKYWQGQDSERKV